MLHLLGQALFGLVVGIIAKVAFPGPDPGGIVVTALIGLVGSMVGTFVGRALWGALTTPRDGSRRSWAPSCSWPSTAP
jgi:uncharacterized membrane protein YeaQ/YmgE (transglycosylase-associated protein family)